MDVKYNENQWERIHDGLGEIVDHSFLGENIFAKLKEITKNLDHAKELIDELDTDRVISFSHTNREREYQELEQDFQVLYDFSDKTGELVQDIIDEPFYKDIDAFVQAIEELSISTYTTTNRIGATETKDVQVGYYGQMTDRQTVKKETVTIDDLFKGDNTYAYEMKNAFEKWKVQHPGEDMTEDDFRTGFVNTRAFQYESIKDDQETKEMWWHLGALVGITVLGILCPPAGLIAGGVYGATEVASAVSGKDFISGRELGAGERGFRAAMAPFDIIPGAGALGKMAGAGKAIDRLEHSYKGMKLGMMGKTKEGFSSIQQLMSKAGDMGKLRGKQAGKFAGTVLKQVLSDHLRPAQSLLNLARKIPMPRIGSKLATEHAAPSINKAARNHHLIENKYANDLIPPAPKKQVLKDGVFHTVDNNPEALKKFHNEYKAPPVPKKVEQELNVPPAPKKVNHEFVMPPALKKPLPKPAPVPTIKKTHGMDGIGNRTQRTLDRLAPRTLEEAHEWGYKHFDRWLDSLTHSEKEAIRQYTGNDYTVINGFLRGRLDSLNGINPQVLKDIKSGLAKAKVPHDMKVYRGTDLMPFDKLIEEGINGMPDFKSLIGKKIKDNAFVSTAILKESSFGHMPVSWEINIPKGASAAYVGKISHFPNEAELLLNAGQEMLIKSVKVDSHNKLHIVLDLILKK